MKKLEQIYSSLETIHSASFLLGGAAQQCYQLGAREAHQLLVGGIAHATGPDPFGNCTPLPRPLLRALCELSVTSFALVKDNFGIGFVVLLYLIHCLLSIESLARILAVNCILGRSSLGYIWLDMY